MVTPAGFSVCQTSSTGCPGFADAGFASNETMRGGGPPARCAATVCAHKTTRIRIARRMTLLTREFDGVALVVDAEVLVNLAAGRPVVIRVLPRDVPPAAPRSR